MIIEKEERVVEDEKEEEERYQNTRCEAMTETRCRAKVHAIALGLIGA